MDETCFAERPNCEPCFEFELLHVTRSPSPPILLGGIRGLIMAKKELSMSEEPDMKMEPVGIGMQELM